MTAERSRPPGTDATTTDTAPTETATTEYDYRSDEIERPDLRAALEERVAGDVRFDTYSRQLYATDASAYEVTPIGVVFPRSTADVASVMAYCADREIPVLPRGGGTSLAGQAVNEAVVLDFTRHMDDLIEIEPDARRARAQSGAYLGDIDAALESSGLKFAPDPAWGDKSALGGAIGNNSTGAHSLVYGKTDAYVESCEVVLADGTITEFGDIGIEDLRERAAGTGAEFDTDHGDDLEALIYAEVVRILDAETDAIEGAYPDLKRNVSGYNLDRLVAEVRESNEDGPGTVNLARLLCGSEGTLAIVTEATIALEDLPETKAVALLTYESLADAMADVEPLLEHDPAAVEVMDDVLLDLARETSEFADVVGILPEGTDSVLLVECYVDSDRAGEQQVADLIADRVANGEHATTVTPGDGAHAITDDRRRAMGAMEAHDADTRARFWKLRKSGLPILLSRTTDAKHISFIEDCAVPPEHLPEYVADFQEILDDYDTHASFYAHAGPGVLHVRPLIDTKTVAGLEQMEGIAAAVTDLVVEYGGSVSGEHGDGRARTGWNRKLYGEDLWETFRDLKTAFDPDWLLNPGQVCGLPDSEGFDGSATRADGAASADSADGTASDDGTTAPSLTENLRFDPDHEFAAGFDPVLEWDNPNGLQGMVELCHGCGGCRGPQDTTGGVMCPTYRASEEEITSTRGRANLLRQAMSGDLDADATDVEFMTEVMDLCIGCKGCANDCPSEVDMAKLKAEVTHAHHREHGASIRDRLFANIDRLSWVGSQLAPVSNWASAVPGARAALEVIAGIAADRDLPTFERRTFTDWFDARGGSRVRMDDVDRRALVLPDTYTNYTHPRAGRAAVCALESAGVHVAVPEGVGDSGRPAFSKGFLEQARATAERNVAELAPRVREGWDVIAIEPSDAVMYQSDYLDLVPPGGVEQPSGTVAAGEGGPRPATDGGRSMADDGRPTSDVESVAANTCGVLEYLDRHRLDGVLDFDAPDRSLIYHGHCHQKATKKDHHAVGVLRRVGYDVEALDSGCCGMAGSFGYEAEHYSMSRAIASILEEQVEEIGDGMVVAPGASCRTQIEDCEIADGEPPHPIEAVATAIVR